MENRFCCPYARGEFTRDKRWEQHAGYVIEFGQVGDKTAASVYVSQTVAPPNVFAQFGRACRHGLQLQPSALRGAEIPPWGCFQFRRYTCLKRLKMWF